MVSDVRTSQNLYLLNNPIIDRLHIHSIECRAASWVHAEFHPLHVATPNMV